MKDGYGSIVKYRAQGAQELKALQDAWENNQRDSFQSVAEFWIQKATEAHQKGKRKGEKLMRFFTEQDLKDILKSVKLSLQDHEKKQTKHMNQNSTKGVMQSYCGFWEADRRSGWGTCILKNGDKYSGMYKNDKMEGRGKYWFYSKTSKSIIYVGEVEDNVFNGLGMMIFADGT
jgi:hypothetical protein